MLLAHAGEHEHVALEDRRVSGKNGIILPPPVDLRRRVSAGIALELNPLYNKKFPFSYLFASSKP